MIWEETETENNILATTEYFYDANGNQISKIYNDLTEQSGAAAGISLEPRTNTLDYEYYEYDGFNRLTSYLTPTTTAEYTYNTKGLRISKTVNGQETRHIWDGSNIVMELNGSEVIDKYIRGYQLIKSDINGYYLYNNHGDVIQLTDQQGTVTTSYLYDAFGIEQEPQPDDPNPFRYCGEYLDKESGNVYLRARYYDPETGRFISEDPIRDGLNWYVYCSNDPVNYIDPSGLAIGDVTMPNGDVIHGTIEDGITHLPDGSRPPEGAVVETAAGFYMMSNGSGVKVTPTSVTTSSNTSNSSSTDNNYGLRAPDYDSLTIGAGVPQIGREVSIIEDRYGNFYLSYGPSKGQKGPSVSCSAGYIIGDYPSEEECYNFLTGPSINYQATYGLGLTTSRSIETGQTGVEGNIGSPSSTVTLSESKYLFNIRETAKSIVETVANKWNSLFN